MSRLRVNSLTNKTNDGAPVFTHGASVVGVVTATSFTGDGSGLTNITGATSIINSGVPYGTATGINFGDNFVVEAIDAQGNATLSVDLSSIDMSSEIATFVAPTVDSAIADIIGAAPTTLDTLQELAAALGDDPNFSVTLATSLDQKANLSGANFTGNITVSGSIAATSYSFANLTEL